MFIKYDEYDLLELFLSEPTSLVDNLETGELMYLFKGEDSFELIMTLSVYEQTCWVSITYKKTVVFRGEFSEVSSLEKRDEKLIINIKGEEKLRLTFKNQISAEVL
ncbi:hypothetical protein [Listeria newyorkensis]|uniref:Uncharacterized protein n=1 Tax=Listeria newyorkensis TaxID=1497681 RepID=A0A841YY74_9LIST|nr:hypothetical protein [Listeria newyorkensis]MBC1458285.1 hypothetical protein [Listeria newyorkensis]